MKWYFKFDYPSVEEGSIQGPFNTEQDALDRKAEIDIEVPGKTHDPYEDSDELPAAKSVYYAQDGEYEVKTDGTITKVS